MDERAHTRRTLIEQAHAAALSACDPFTLVVANWPAELDGAASLHVIAIGKGSAGMLRAVGERCPGATGIGLVVPGSQLDGLPPGIEYLETDHPIPSPRNVRAAERVEAFARSLSSDDTLLVLISGGGSAQLCLPEQGLTLDDLRSTTRRLIRAGTPIDELNAVRRRLERLKGGGLAAVTRAKTYALAISDVGNHDPHTVSSGPLHPPPPGEDDRIARLQPMFTPAVRDAIATTPATKPASDPEHFVVMATYRTAVAAAGSTLRDAGYRDASDQAFETGSAAEVGRAATRRDSTAPGTFTVQGCELAVDASDATGLGGRSQECALAAAIELDGAAGTTVAALSTDGIDGPTDAAGAIVDGGSVGRMRAAGVDPLAALANHDSYLALRASGDLLITGPTGTNVNDLLVTVVDPSAVH